VRFQTEPQIAVELVRRTQAPGRVHFDWVTADETYGRNGAFLDDLEAIHQQYVVEVPVTTTVWTVDPLTQVPPSDSNAASNSAAGERWLGLPAQPRHGGNAGGHHDRVRGRQSGLGCLPGCGRFSAQAARQRHALTGSPAARLKPDHWPAEIIVAQEFAKVLVPAGGLAKPATFVSELRRKLASSSAPISTRCRIPNL
jgi:hypothetical protein